jgi:hypothetical protein
MLTAIPFPVMLLTKSDYILTITPWDRILEKLIKETLHLLWNLVSLPFSQNFISGSYPKSVEFSSQPYMLYL